MLRLFEKTETRRFTLVELVVVVIIVGILISIAVPAYLKAPERGRATDARRNLDFMCDAEKIFIVDHATFTSSLSDLILISEGLATDDGNWSYLVPRATVSLFTVQAVRKSGPYSNYKISMDQDSLTGYQDASGGSITAYPP